MKQPDATVPAEPVTEEVNAPPSIASFSYTSATPPGYACTKCGATGCRLWRRYQTFLEHQELTCFACTEKLEPAGHPYTSDSHAIGWRVAAVPTEDGETFWGYTSVPDAGVAWWNALPVVGGEPTGKPTVQP